jgi:hypothetical protein
MAKRGLISNHQNAPEIKIWLQKSLQTFRDDGVGRDAKHHRPHHILGKVKKHLIRTRLDRLFWLDFLGAVNGYKLIYPTVDMFRSLALFRHPPVTGAYGAVLLTPFEMRVWMSCAGIWLLVILIIRLVSWIETSTLDFSATSHEGEMVRSWSDSLMIIVGTISEQGS